MIKPLALAQKIFSTLFIMILTLSASACKAEDPQDKISLFSLANYDQRISTWIPVSDPNYDRPLFSPEIQQKRFASFYDHAFGAKSPWSPDHINSILHKVKGDDLKQTELSIIYDFTNQNKPEDQIAYGENFHPHTLDWIHAIKANIHLAQFDQLTYSNANRGIAVENMPLRALPTEDPSFYSYKLAGEGYPFDNLQMSAVWAGTPVYILGETEDHAWLLVVTPDCIAWVKSKGIAHADDRFVNTWQQAAKKQMLAITQTQSSVTDDQNRFLFSAYVGSVFPADSDNSSASLLAPAADANQNAVIKHAHVGAHNAAVMPLAATPHHMADVMSSLIGRPYGWGNLYFYNDCSAELKNLYAPFGIWLPRHSSDQVTVGKLADVSTMTAEKRLNYLMENGRPLMTIIYIGGHVLMYTGKFANPNASNHEPMVMTYQNMWGLSPRPANQRHVIGRSVLFPMLLHYPEDTSLHSLADKKEFQVSYLDEMPNNYLINEQVINLKSLMYSS